MMKYLSLGLILFSSAASAQVPAHDHVVVVIMENKGYSQIINSPAAQYINQLIQGSDAALFTKSYALTYPSQPNYLMLYSGSNQNLPTNNTPPPFMLPFSAPNLGAALISKGKTFIGYSQGLPAVGFSGDTAGPWVRRHCPWINWQASSGVNTIPPSSNVPFTAFPLSFDSLPSVSFVIPDLINDMHDGTIQQGDNWMKNNLDGYVQWAKTHNSLFILHFDEDSHNDTNHIVTLFVGQNVLKGNYPGYIDHYNILRTLEDMYGLPYAGYSASASPIIDCWKTSGVSGLEEDPGVLVYPDPSYGIFTVQLDAVLWQGNRPRSELSLEICNALGEKIWQSAANTTAGKFLVDISTQSSGTYFLRAKTSDRLIRKKIILQR